MSGRTRHLRVVPRSYSLPDACASLEDGLRLLNEDVATFTAREAWAELYRVRRVLADLVAHGDRVLWLPPHTRLSAENWCRRRLALLMKARAS